MACKAFIAAATLAGASAAQAVVLYDAAAGTPPSSQGWFVLADGAAGASVAGGEYRLDTTALAGAFGHARVQPLDTAAGFELAFTLRIDAEVHTSANRAGYSVLLVGNDPSRALELAFWDDSVWAYDHNAADADRFVRGADAAFATTTTHDYVLAVRNHQFTLAADGGVLLSGALRDYRAEGLPYTVPGLIFFGDDSSRGTSLSALANVQLLPVPEPAPALLLAAGLAALAWRCRRA